MTDDTLRRAQPDDPDIAPVWGAKKAEIRWSAEECSDFSTTTKQLFKQWDVLVWKGNEVLSRLWFDNNNQTRQQIADP